MLAQTFADEVILLRQIELDLEATISPSAKLVEALRVLDDSYNSVSAFRDAKYAEALQNAAEAVAEIWGESNIWVKAGSDLINIAGKVYEAQSILERQATLMEARYNIAKALSKFDSNPAATKNWSRIMNQLRGDPARMHDAFLRSHPAIGARKSIITNAIQSSGVKALVDPSDFAVKFIPGMNPDFIAAWKRQAELLAMLNRGENVGYQLMTVDKYPDGSYINIMGAGRGLSADAIDEFRRKQAAKNQASLDAALNKGISYGPSAFNSPSETTVGYTPGATAVVFNWRGSYETVWSIKLPYNDDGSESTNKWAVRAGEDFVQPGQSETMRFSSGAYGHNFGKSVTFSLYGGGDRTSIYSDVEQRIGTFSFELREGQVANVTAAVGQLRVSRNMTLLAVNGKPLGFKDQGISLSFNPQGKNVIDLPPAIYSVKIGTRLITVKVRAGQIANLTNP